MGDETYPAFCGKDIPCRDGTIIARCNLPYRHLGDCAEIAPDDPDDACPTCGQPMPVKP